MKKKIIIILHVAVCMVLSHIVSGQQLMINGDFENWVPVGDQYGIDISNIPGWQTITGSCDVKHSQNGNSISGTPYNGVGCGRFFAAAQAADEICAGTTLPLTAGSTYTVSFWVRRVLYSGAPEKSMSVAVSSFLPTIQLSPGFNANVTPEIEIFPTSSYQKISFCYTAQVSGTHYITFGPWKGYANSDQNKSIEYNLDDVEVTLLNPSIPLPITSLTIPQTTYCTGNNVTVDGSLSANGTSYIWEVYRTDLGYEQLEYTSGIQNGSPGTLDVSAVIGAVSPGQCYRVYLKLLGTCVDEAVVNFCFVNPNIDFIGAGSAVCENTPVDLTVTGDNGWTYAWSTGQTGVGLKTVTVTPTQGNSTYSVTVTTPEGCIHTETVTLKVHSQNNIAPWMNGVNGSGEYTAYVQQGGSVYFWSYLFNDNSNEVISIGDNFNNLPPLSSYQYNEASAGGGVMDFSISTSSITPVGVYYFTLTANDKNVCVEGISTFTFTIIVICDQCPVCISYEDRTPTNNPLPPETKVGDCINAGFTDPVETGQQTVLFQAGNTIDLGNSFSAGPGFQAVIEPTTCVTDCEDCCSDWAGFTYDHFFDGQVISIVDADPTNDFFQITDIAHPFCAYGALGYKLWIRNDDNVAIYSESLGNPCCSFESPAIENPIPRASIYCDMLYTNAFGNEVYVYDDVFFYELTLIGCNGQEDLIQGYFYWNGYVQSGMALNDGPVTGIHELEEQSSLETQNEEPELLEPKVELFPNPTSDELFVLGIDDLNSTKVQLFDARGNMLTRREFLAENGSFNVKHLSLGEYYLRIYFGDRYIVKKFIKQ